MRQKSLLVALGVFALVMATLVGGRSAGTTLAGTPVDLTGEWGYVYSFGGPTFVGGCTAELLQTGSTITSAVGGEMECESGGSPTATGGVISGTLSGLDLTWHIDFDGLSVDVLGTISLDGDTDEGVWGLAPALDAGTYLGSRLAATCASPPCTDETVTFLEDTATVTFDEVTATGGTTVISTETTTTGGILPASFQLAGTGWASDPFYTVLTTTEFTGDINFCLSYQDADNDGFVDGKSPPVSENRLRLLHNATGSFDAGTVNSIDTTNNVICAIVSGLSEFALGAQVEPPPVGGVSLEGELSGLPQTTVTPSSGPSLVLLAVISAALLGVVALGGSAWYVRRRWLN